VLPEPDGGREMVEWIDRTFTLGYDCSGLDPGTADRPPI
jgi:hypothetical protein